MEGSLHYDRLNYIEIEKETIRREGEDRKVEAERKDAE